MLQPATSSGTRPTRSESADSGTDSKVEVAATAAHSSATWVGGKPISLARNRMNALEACPSVKSASASSTRRNAGGKVLQDQSGRLTRCTSIAAGSYGQRQRDGQRTGHCRPQQDFADRDLPRQQRRRQQRTNHRAGVVKGAVDTEGKAALRRRHRVGQQGIARRGAQPFAEPVQHAQHQQRRPCGDQRNGGPSDRREAIANEHESLGAPDAVVPDTGHQLQQRRGRFGGTFDESQRPRTA